MPESIKDRCTKSHEYIFMFSKRERYYFDHYSIKEPAYRHGYRDKAKRSVWEVQTRGYPDAHFATFPVDLVAPMVIAGCPIGGSILDPFGGAGTTGVVAARLGRNATLIELSAEYARMARERIEADAAQNR